MKDFEQQVEEHFNKCLELPVEKRATYVEKTFSDRKELGTRILELLRAHEKAGDFLESLPGSDSTQVAKRLHRVAPADESAGDQIGRYRLIKRIGEGAHGTVWLAEQTEDIKRKVALKILKLGMDTKEFVSRFEVEKQVLALLDHPSIATVYDAGATKFGRPYFVMELVETGPLWDLADQSQLSVKDRIKIFVKVCRALQHAHEKGVVHRDLKPSNILTITIDGEVIPKIIDFGIAKIMGKLSLDEDPVTTNIRVFVGTPIYSSPEQLENRNRVDHRSDIYCLGLLLYEFLCGKYPFNIDQLAQSGLKDFKSAPNDRDPPRPSSRYQALTIEEQKIIAQQRGSTSAQLAGLLKGDLDNIIMKCLDRNPDYRYQSAAILVEDLEAFLDGRPVSAAGFSPIRRIRKFITRKRPAYAVWLEVALALVTIAAVFFYIGREQNQDTGSFLSISPDEISEKSIAVLPLENRSPNPENAFFADGVQEELMTRLASVEELLVISRTSTLQYQDSVKPLSQIGRELRVKYLLAGSVQRADQQVRVSVRLIDAASEATLWAGSYTETLADFFSIFTTISMKIAQELETILSPEEIAQFDQPPTRNQAAYDYHLQAKRKPWDEAIQLQKKATELDSEFYDAWRGLAHSQLLKWKFDARGTDPRLLAEASKALKQVKRLAPDSGTTLALEAEFAYQVEDDIQQALLYDLKAKSLGIGGKNVGMRYLQMGRLNEARYNTEESLRIDPLDDNLVERLYWIYLYLDMWVEARRLLEDYQSKVQTDIFARQYFDVSAQQEYLETGDLERYLKTQVPVTQTMDHPRANVWASLVSRDHRLAATQISKMPPDWFGLIGPVNANYDIGLFVIRDILSALNWFVLGEKEKWLMDSRKARARMEYRIVRTILEITKGLSMLTICYALEGDSEKVESTIPLIRQRSHSENQRFRYQILCELHIAIAYLVLGDHDKAIETLEAASKMDGPIFLNRELKIWFIFDRLRGNPRFEALLEG